jgi:hypothetical protein
LKRKAAPLNIMEENLLSNILYSTEVTNEQNRALLVLLSKQTALLVEISQGLKEISAKLVTAKSTDVNQMPS